MMIASRAALHRVWTHPLVAAGRRPVRDALWLARGRGLANPEFPPRIASILFVCQGNICRSPFAALRARQLLDEAGLTRISVSSAGLVVKEGARPPVEGCQAAAAFGVRLEGHQPLQLTGELLMGHDMTVVMEASQVRYLRETYPGAGDRVFLLALLDDAANRTYERFNITDPFGLPAAAFEECYRRIDNALRRLLRRAGSADAVEPGHSGDLRGERQ